MKKINNTHAFSIRKYPLFGRGIYSEDSPPEGVKKSPFYWWFKFLQLNKEYGLAIEGKKTSIAKSVVKDFGDVRKTDFKKWWQARVDLFAEPQLNYKMMIANDVSEIAPFNSEEVINIVVPLNWTNVGIKRSFARIIDKKVPKVKLGKRGIQIKSSEALFKIGRKWSIQGFENSYKVYIERQKADAEMLKGAKKVSWADIGIRVGLKGAKGLVEGKNTHSTSDQRRVLTILTIRHYKKAEAFIKSAATNIFPSVM